MFNSFKYSVAWHGWVQIRICIPKFGVFVFELKIRKGCIFVFALYLKSICKYNQIYIKMTNKRSSSQDNVFHTWSTVADHLWPNTSFQPSMQSILLQFVCRVGLAKFHPLWYTWTIMEIQSTYLNQIFKMSMYLNKKWQCIYIWIDFFYLNWNLEKLFIWFGWFVFDPKVCIWTQPWCLDSGDLFDLLFTLVISHTWQLPCYCSVQLKMWH